MKKLISAILSASMLLSGAVVYAADAVSVINEQFEYESTELMKEAGWTLSVPAVNTPLTEAYAEVKNGVLNTKMNKSAEDRSIHTISAQKALSQTADGLLTLTAGIGLSEEGSRYTNSSAEIEFIDADGNTAAEINLRSSHGSDPSGMAAWIVTVGSESKTVYQSEFLPAYDDTIYNIKLVSNKKENTVNFYVGNDSGPLLSFSGCYIPAVDKIGLLHSQISYKNPWTTNSAGFFDYVTLTSEEQVIETTPPDEGDEDDEPDTPPADDNDPAIDEDEGINNQQNILYDTFSDTSAWEVTLPDQTGLAECYTEVKNGILKTKMQKTLTGREIHTISLHKKLDKEISTEAVLRAGIGLEETGSKYTNSAASIVLYDMLGSEVARVYMNSSHGGTQATNAVWVVQTNQITQNVLGADFPVDYKEEVFDIKIHIKPESGVMDFYAADLTTPILAEVPYDANGVFISDVVLEHTQVSYNKAYISNSAAYFDYIKLDADIEVKEADVQKTKAAADSISERHLTTEDKDNVTKRITLPNYSDNGCTIVWTSSDEDVISSKGIVTRHETENKTVTLTARFISGYADFYKDYTFTVPAIGIAMWKEFFYESYDSEVQGMWEMSYPSPKADNTDCIVVADPDDDGNKVMRHSNHMTSPQAYAGFQATCDMGFMFDGRAKISCLVRIENSANSTSVNFQNNNGQTVAGVGTAGSVWSVNGEDTDVKVEEGKWTELVLDINTYEGYLNVYIDGKDCGIFDVTENYDKNYKIAQYNLYSWNRSSGNHAKLYIDDLCINENLNVRLDSVRQSLKPEALSGEVAGDFEVPVENDGVNINWKSSDEGAISFDADGKATVTRAAEDKAVTVTAELDYKGCKVTKNFSVNVIHQYTDKENVDADVLYLENKEFSNESTDRITKSFDLDLSGKYGSEISWESSNEAVIKIEDGKAVVTGAKEDTVVTLTATVTNNTETVTKEFTFTVLAALNENLLKDSYITGVSSELANSPAGNLVDDNFSTSYKTAISATNHEVTIALAEEQRIGAFLVKCEDNVKSVEILVSADNDFYKSVYKSDSIGNERTKITVEPSTVNYVKFIVTPIDSNKSAEISELMAFTSFLSDAESVEADLNALSIASSVSSNITLRTEGNNGSVITWESSNEAVIKTNGNVIRGTTDIIVTLTATATKNGATAKKTFTVTVKAKSSDGGSGGGSSSEGISSGSGDSSIVLSGTQSTNEGETDSQAFSDVDKNMWSYRYIEMLRKKGMVSGDGGFFRPKSNITREEFATMLYKCSPCEPELKEMTFADITETHWAYEFVKKLYSDGVIAGISKTEFGTGINITRQDATVMTLKVLEKTHTDLKEYELKFVDSEYISEYAKASVSKLSGTGIINGRDDNTFAPQDLLTREEAAKMMCVLVSLIG